MTAIEELEKSVGVGFVPKTPTILTTRGSRETLEQSLVAPFGKPRGGWFVNVSIKGIPTRITDSDANRVFISTKRLLDSNGVGVPDIVLWFNLNIQWYSRLPEKYMLVRHNALLDLADTSNNPKTVNPSARNYSPANWGWAAWDFMGVFLAQDEYDWIEFTKLLEVVQRLLNHGENPSIGCNDCYIEFTKQINMLRQNPIYDVAVARKWLIDFHNSVNVRLNKPVFAYETAAKRYLWK